MSMLDLASWALILAGSFFCVRGGIGLLRLPDFYTRAHAGGVTDTLGASLMLGGFLLQAGASLVGVKLLLILLVLYLTSPTGTHAVVKAAYARGIRAEGTDG